MAPDEPALSAFQTRTPMLVVGSHAWNKPYNEAGDMVCGAQQQRAILAAASAGRWVTSTPGLGTATRGSKDSVQLLTSMLGQQLGRVTNVQCVAW